MKKLLFLTLIFAFSYVMADTDAEPTPYIKTADYSPYYFIMIPEKYEFRDNDFHITKPAFGKAYELLTDGSTKELWQVKDWYAFDVYLAYDGAKLVRMGEWGQGETPSDKDLAVAFYKNGELLKKYSTADLIKQKNSIELTASHYIWIAGDKAFPRLGYDDTFKLKTIEQIIYEFDLNTGEIISSTKG